MFHCSNYSKIWDTLTSHYDEENILVLDGDRFVEDPVLVLRSVERFLHLPPFFSDQHFTFNGKKGMPCFKLDEESLDRCMGGSKGMPCFKLDEESLDRCM